MQSKIDGLTHLLHCALLCCCRTTITTCTTCMAYSSAFACKQCRPNQSASPDRFECNLTAKTVLRQPPVTYRTQPQHHARAPAAAARAARRCTRSRCVGMRGCRGARSAAAACVSSTLTLRRPLWRLRLNTTMPSLRANSVWSLPCSERTCRLSHDG